MDPAFGMYSKECHKRKEVVKIGLCQRDKKRTSKAKRNVNIHQKHTRYNCVKESSVYGRFARN